VIGKKRWALYLKNKITEPLYLFFYSMDLSVIPDLSLTDQALEMVYEWLQTANIKAHFNRIN